MIKIDFKKWSLFSGIWFGFLGFVCPVLFWKLGPVDQGTQVYTVFHAISATFWGGYWGYRLTSAAEHVSLKRIVFIGIAISILSMTTTFILVAVLAEGRFLDGLVIFFQRILVGFLVSHTGIIVTFWLFWPINIVGAFLLNLYTKSKMRIVVK